MRRYEVISADGHLEVEPEFWTKYLPAKYQDRKPVFYTFPNGEEGVKFGESTYRGTRRGPLDDDQFIPGAEKYRFPDGSYRDGVGPASQRLQEQDKDGIDAEFLYSDSGLRGSFYQKVVGAKEPDFYLALVQAYNTWLGQEYCAAAPDRLIGSAVVPVTGVEDAIKEAERCKKIGLNSVSIAFWPNGSGHYQPGDEKFFQAMVDLDMLVSPHSSFGAGAPKAGGDGVPGGGGGIDGVLYHRAAGPAYGVTQLIIQGIFDKSPRTKIYMGETYVSYLPFNYNRMDEHYIRRRHYYNFKLKKLPSEYIRDQMAFSFIHERPAMQFRNYIGIDNLMWGSDFPHTVNTYPYSKVSLDEMFLDVPEDEKRRVLVTTPCKWFGLDPEKELTPTPQ